MTKVVLMEKSLYISYVRSISGKAKDHYFIEWAKIIKWGTSWSNGKLMWEHIKKPN